MSYRIEANIHGKNFIDLPASFAVIHIEDSCDAEDVFKFFLDNGVRPVRLFDEDEDEDNQLLKRAENGIRRSC